MGKIRKYENDRIHYLCFITPIFYETWIKIMKTIEWKWQKKRVIQSKQKHDFSFQTKLFIRMNFLPFIHFSYSFHFIFIHTILFILFVSMVSFYVAPSTMVLPKKKKIFWFEAVVVFFPCFVRFWLA